MIFKNQKFADSGIGSKKEVIAPAETWIYETAIMQDAFRNPRVRLAGPNL